MSRTDTDKLLESPETWDFHGKPIDIRPLRAGANLAWQQKVLAFIKANAGNALSGDLVSAMIRAASKDASNTIDMNDLIRRALPLLDVDLVTVWNLAVEFCQFDEDTLKAVNDPVIGATTEEMYSLIERVAVIGIPLSLIRSRIQGYLDRNPQIRKALSGAAPKETRKNGRSTEPISAESSR